MNYTYILKCSDGTLYCGWTNNLEKRVEAHNAGKGAKYTKSRRPVELVYFECFKNKQEAQSREWHLKKLSRNDKIKLINEFDGSIEINKSIEINRKERPMAAAKEMISYKDELINGFEKVFGDRSGVRVFFAPGRVNLIGEHTDYNGGHVFPCALTIGTYAAARKRTDRTLRFYSANFTEKGVIEASLDDLVYKKETDWANYVCGVISVFEKRGMIPDTGFDFYCLGTIPNGSGLSSSASLEVLTAQVLKSLYSFNVDNINMALIGQEAENKYIGVNCGIMDQFAVACGKKDSAIFLDTATLDYKYVPVKLDGIRIVIGNTCKKRGLGDSKYNERRSECESALEKLQTVCDIKVLGELDVKTFEAHSNVIGDEIKEKRARHAVTENIRTLDAVEALEAGNIDAFGKLMNASHESLKKDYEVTGAELDTMVEAAWKRPETIGARMTGAGFGGCTVSLVKADGVEAFIENVGKEYEEKIGYKGEFYVVDIGDGPCEL